MGKGTHWPYWTAKHFTQTQVTVPQCYFPLHSVTRCGRCRENKFAHLASLAYPECRLTETMTAHGFLFAFFSPPLVRQNMFFFFAINRQFSSRWPCFNRQRCVCSAGCMDWIWSKACHAHNHINPTRKSRGLQGSETRGYFTTASSCCVAGHLDVEDLIS